MTLLAIGWLATFGVLALLSLRRAVWGVSLYFLTYFALPDLWGWGTALAPYRWNLLGALILALAVGVDGFRQASGGAKVWLTHWHLLQVSPWHRWILLLIAGMVGNASIVHFVLAPDAAISRPDLIQLIKISGLAVLIFLAVRRPGDDRIARTSLLFGLLYLGYAVIVLGEGTMINGRLERVGPPGAREANALPALLFVGLPLVWRPLCHGRWAERLLAVATLLSIVRVIYLCNSRGAYLSAVLAAMVMWVLAPRALRRSWAIFCLFGIVALYVVAGGLAPAFSLFEDGSRESSTSKPDSKPAAESVPGGTSKSARVQEPPESDPEPVKVKKRPPTGPPRTPPPPTSKPKPESDPESESESEVKPILERFVVLPEELSKTTSGPGSRLRFWHAGLMMLADYPFGSGGDSFLKIRGSAYLAEVDIHSPRALHNGYLTEATNWGVQGLLLRLALCALLFLKLRQLAFRPAPSEVEAQKGGVTRIDAWALAVCLAVLMAANFFGNRLHLEWIYWLVGLTLAMDGELRSRRVVRTP